MTTTGKDFRVNRRRFLSGLTMAGAVAGSAVAGAMPASAVRCPPDRPDGLTPMKIDAVEVLELHGHYAAESGVDHQPQVNPLDVYDELRPEPYADRPGPTRDVQYEAHYLRIRTAAGLEGLYGPIEREPATIVLEDLKQFLIGKDALAGEVLWDEMYRSNRHSRAGYFLMAISAVDNALWDLRGKFYGVPVWRLLGGPSRDKVEMYASALGFSLEPDSVRKRCLELKNQGFRYQKWFIGYSVTTTRSCSTPTAAGTRTMRLSGPAKWRSTTLSGWKRSRTRRRSTVSRRSAAARAFLSRPESTFMVVGRWSATCRLQHSLLCRPIRSGAAASANC